MHPDLTDAALEGGYSAATVVELCRFYYDQPRLAELGDDQAVDMAGRLRLAGVQGVEDERLRRMAAKGLIMNDGPPAREAADIWLTFRAADTGPRQRRRRAHHLQRRACRLLFEGRRARRLVGRNL